MSHSSAQPNPNFFAQRVEALRSELSEADPHLLAERAGAAYREDGPGRGELQLAMWNKEILLDYPGWAGREAAGQAPISLSSLAALLYYFRTADGTPLANRWVSFADLPGGRFYNQAFQGYSGGALAQAYRAREQDFQEAARLCGGDSFPAGTLAYRFQVLPRLPLLVVYWAGDEDFPASFQVLFDAAAPHYLPIDVGAILGGALARKLIAARA